MNEPPVLEGLERLTLGPQHPWLETRLPEEAMNYLWKLINNPVGAPNAKANLAGNISKSTYITDKEDFFYKNILKDLIEYLYYIDWNNYYEVYVAKSSPATLFTLKNLWVNYQKQHEFNPLHGHKGMYSFVVFMKIPTHWKEQHALPISADSGEPCASDFQFVFRDETHNIPLCPEDEGRMLFFPAWLQHQVFPFYECEEERITVSGNIDIDPVET